jgi:hypothetical protein
MHRKDVDCAHPVNKSLFVCLQQRAMLFFRRSGLSSKQLKKSAIGSLPPHESNEFNIDKPIQIKQQPHDNWVRVSKHRRTNILASGTIAIHGHLHRA